MTAPLTPPRNAAVKHGEYERLAALYPDEETDLGRITWMTDDTEPHGTDPNEDEPPLPDNDPVPDDPELTEIDDEEENEPA